MAESKEQMEPFGTNGAFYSSAKHDDHKYPLEITDKQTSGVQIVVCYNAI
jgi:hypothetical protein